jgi:5-methyltetrahydrofolate--homocysteine methyltransferase
MSAHGNRHFIIIGENVHTTRVLTRKSPRLVVKEDGREGLAFTNADGRVHFLVIPETMKRSQDYQEGRIKHVKLAVQAAMGDDREQETAGQAYLRHLVQQQERAGTHFLDINVDEISIRSADQKAAMDWLARFVQSCTRLPLSIDSSNMAVIEAGMAACRDDRERPLLNSASLERKDALDIAHQMKARVIVTAAGERGMPSGVDDRVANASRMIEAARSKGIASSEIFVDPLIFPISVDKSFALHSLDAMRELRSQFGSEIHITGGFSNVSFGIPHRRAINDLFMKLAVAAGADSGIIDPVSNPPDRTDELDPASKPYRLAEDVLLGRDEHCRNYIRAWRKGEIQ